MWAEYHRRQADTLVNLALLTRDRDTAISFMRVAGQHARKAKQAVSEHSKHTSSLPEAVTPSISP